MQPIPQPTYPQDPSPIFDPKPYKPDVDKEELTPPTNNDPIVPSTPVAPSTDVIVPAPQPQEPISVIAPAPQPQEPIYFTRPVLQPRPTTRPGGLLPKQIGYPLPTQPTQPTEPTKPQIQIGVDHDGNPMYIDLPDPAAPGEPQLEIAPAPMQPIPVPPPITLNPTLTPEPVETTTTPQPVETVNEPAPASKTLSQIDQLIDELLADDEGISIEDLEELIAKMQTLLHQRQKKLNKEITSDFEKIRDVHLKQTVSALKGPAVFYITLGSGILQFASGVSGVSPKATLSGAGHLNNGVHKVTRGKVPHVFDLSGINMSDPKDVAKVVKTTSKALQGSAAMSGSVQSVADNRKHTITTEHNSKEGTAKQKVQTLDQENQNTGQKVDDAKRDAGSKQERRHAAKKAIFGF